MKRYMCFSILLLLLFVFSSCDSPSGSKPDAITKPSLVSPNDNATNISISPTFEWTGAADKLEVALNINFTSGLRTYDVTGQTFTLPEQLINNQRYYWHAGKTSGSDIYWSDEKFTFMTAP